MKPDERIAIVGVGGVFPSSDDLLEFWTHIRQGTYCCRDVPSGRWTLPPDVAYAAGTGVPDKVYSTRAGFIESFQPRYDGLRIRPESLRELDVLFQLAVEAARLAVQDAGIDTADRSRTGVVLGNIALPTEASSKLTDDFLGRTFAELATGGTIPQDPSGVHPLNRFVAGLPAGIVAQALGLGGGTFALDAACASSLYALKFAVDELREGRADMMLAGGVSRPDSLYTQMGFSQLQALSHSGVCAPFDAGADGLVVGEGAGIVVLKRLADALRDGDRIYATIAGIGLSNDRDGRLMAPRSEGQLRAMREAYRQAGWAPNDIDLIECHATGTPVGDLVELESLHELWDGLPARAGQCVLGCVKSNIGHLLTGAGAAGLIKVLLAMQHETLPPTANLRTPAGPLADERSPFRVLTEAAPWERQAGNKPRRAAINAFGFGGINAHVLIEEWDRAASATSISVPMPAEDPLQPIAIVGLSTHFGPWDSLSAFQHRVLGGGPTAVEMTEPNWWGAEQSEWFRAELGSSLPHKGHYLKQLRIPVDRFRIPPKELEEMLPQQLLMLGVAADALVDAGLEGPLGNRSGVFVGIGLDLNTTNFHFRWSLWEKAAEWNRELGLSLSDEEREAWLERLRTSAGPALSANRTMGALGSIVASRVAREFGVGGPSLTISSEESSALRALDLAVQALRRGDLDQALVGAVDLAGDIRAVLATDQARPFSSSGSVRPFDADADGSVVGEGAAAFVLKRLDDAIRDNDRVYAVIRGVGIASEGDIEREVPRGGAYRSALDRAYRQARVAPESIGLLIAQGTGRNEEDGMEAEALAEFFSGVNGANRCALGSAVADVGHAGAAAGAASLAKAILCLYHETVPPIRNVEHPRTELAKWGNAYLPMHPQFWLHNREEGPRRAGVSAFSVDGNCVHVVLEAVERRSALTTNDRSRPLGPLAEGLFTIEGASKTEIASGLDRLQSLCEQAGHASIDGLARQWYTEQPPSSHQPLGMSIISRDLNDVLRQIDRAREVLRDAAASQSRLSATSSNRVYFSPNPLGRDARVAFVFPGSGNGFPGMGRGLFCNWPDVLRRQYDENRRLRDQFVSDGYWNRGTTSGTPNHKQAIFAQVALGSAMSDLLTMFGIRPEATLGYSLGESAALFALRAWTDRDEMLARMHRSSLFGSDVVHPFDAARNHWQWAKGVPVDWVAGIVNRSADAVRAVLPGHGRVYLLISNHGNQCVIGGERSAVTALVDELDGTFVPASDPSSVHCEIVNQVEQAYRELHLLPTAPPKDVRFYSAALGGQYAVNRESAADAILAQALATVDFPRVVEAVYRDGVRIFLEMGPGASCSRLITEILGSRPYVARSACQSDANAVGDLLSLLGQLHAERVPIDLEPLYGGSAAIPVHTLDTKCVVVDVGGKPFTVPAVPRPKTRVEPTAQLALITTRSDWETEPMPFTMAPAANPLSEFAAAQTAKGEAHAVFLRISERVTKLAASQQEFQFSVLSQMRDLGVPVGTVAASAPPRRMIESSPHPATLPMYGPPRALNREQCLQFAVGAIGDVLGPEFAAIDDYPARVRLPDEPLMLVDRITAIEGAPNSMSSGRVVTEHDVLHEGWYLDCERIPTCIAIEAGQADLFLCAFLGVDFQTRGRSVYRLLDAAVTFHSGLPGPGSVIRYDIRINRFFRQGESHFFRFEFDGTVNGEPLMSMRDGCAGFFTPEQLDGGQGVVQTALDRRQIPGRRPDDWTAPVPMVSEGYSSAQLDALRDGDLRECFGDDFSGLPLTHPVTLPSGRMRVVHRVVHLDPQGGRFGLGLIRAELDVDPDDWFLTCHFQDDNVMPGTLMFECCLHTLRVFLLRLGWLGERDDTAFEPVPEVTSRLECRGQVIASTKTVAFEVSIKEVGYNPAPYAIADTLIYADGKPVVSAIDCSLQLTGSSRDAIESLWNRRNQTEHVGTLACGAAVSAARGRRDACTTNGIGSVAPTRNPVIFDRDQFLEFATGRPSKAFGDRYRHFDHDRIIARLPGPPFLLVDRVMHVTSEPWVLRSDVTAQAEYDVPADAWYFAANRQTSMPFAVLLEIALQPCGWLAAYLGSALTSDSDLSFRNLGGTAIQHEAVTPESGTLTTTIRLTRVSKSGGMIIQNFDFRVTRGSRLVYEGDTYFGFFSKEALSRQVGIKDVVPYELPVDEAQRAIRLAYPDQAPFPDSQFRMVDRIDALVENGGTHGLGFVRGVAEVNPDVWFFKAHFYQDPVWPGSLGLESFLQLLKAYAIERWGGGIEQAPWPSQYTFQSPAVGKKHSWTYRGQVIPQNKLVTVEANLSLVDDSLRRLEADGTLSVDGRVIYQMDGFTLEMGGGPQ